MRKMSLDRVGGLASMWGRDAPLRDDLNRRLFRLVNGEDNSDFHLSTLGSDARSAAQVIDSELLRLVEISEYEAVNIMQIFNRTAPGRSVAPILDQVKKARKADEEVAARVRKLRR
jgi:hypothetical protein